MIELTQMPQFPGDLTLESIDRNRAELQALIARCQGTIADACRILEQLDAERNRLAELQTQHREAMR